MDHKVAETTYNIKNPFWLRKSDKLIVQWFKRFAKEVRALKMKSAVAGL